MFVRAWESGSHEDIEGASTAEVHFSDGRVVQITCAEGKDPRGDGMVLLRAWRANGTHEYGGDNLEDLSLTLLVGDENTSIESVRFDRHINAWHRTRRAEEG